MTVMERPRIKCLKFTKWCRDGSHHGEEYVDEHVEMKKYTARNAIDVVDHNSSYCSIQVVDKNDGTNGSAHDMNIIDNQHI